MKRLTAVIVVCAGLALLPAFTASAEVRVESTALGSDGQLVSLLSGTYGELFPAGNAAQPDVHVMAIRHSSPDGTETLDLVPPTLDQDRETAAELVLDPVSGISYVFWQSWSNLIHSRFRISSFDGATWSEPIDVTRSGFAWRTSPAFAVTHDRFHPLGADDGSEVMRTVLHVVWSEETENDRWSTMYAPLVLEDGKYVGHHPVLALNDLVADAEGGPSTDLQIAPVIRPRNNENSIAMAFLDQRSGKLVTLESKFIAGELSILGDEVDQVLSEQSLDGGIEPVLEAVQDRLNSFREELRAEVLDPISLAVDEYLHGQAENGNIANVRDGARPHLIDFGFRATSRDIRRVHGDARPHLIDFGVRGRSEDKPGQDVRHDARSLVTTTFDVPDLATPPQLLLSYSGRHLVLTWIEEDRIRFRESASDSTWSDLQQIPLTDQLDAAEALSVLQRRIDQK